MKDRITKACQAVARLAAAASTMCGSDCLTLAGLLYTLLHETGIKAKFCAGEVFWRVGDGDSDVIVHSPQCAPPQAGNFAGHVWLTVDMDGQEWIVDCTTGQLPHKAAVLDSLDGGKTTVTWAPDVLVVPTQAMKSHPNQVANGNAGDFWYGNHQGLAAALAAHVLPNVDPEDMTMLRLIHASPNAIVCGVATAQNRLCVTAKAA